MEVIDLDVDEASDAELGGDVLDRFGGKIGMLLLKSDDRTGGNRKTREFKFIRLVVGLRLLKLGGDLLGDIELDVLPIHADAGLLAPDHHGDALPGEAGLHPQAGDFRMCGL